MGVSGQISKEHIVVDPPGIKLASKQAMLRPTGAGQLFSDSRILWSTTLLLSSSSSSSSLV